MIRKLTNDILFIKKRQHIIEINYFFLLNISHLKLNKTIYQATVLFQHIQFLGIIFCWILEHPLKSFIGRSSIRALKYLAPMYKNW